MIRPISSNFTREDGSRFFDSASLARLPETLAQQSSQPIAVDWDGMISQARHSLGFLLAPEKGVGYAFEPDAHITLFTNTTSAFTRVLSRIEKSYAGSEPTLLTTDLEYPGCVAAIDDAWSGPVVMARVASSLIHADEPDTILADALIRSHNFVKPRVVFVSHVMRTTGQVLSPTTLRNLRELNPRVIVVIDGSQAAGNVVVTRELLAEADFYIASGHKWLGGSTTSGFAWLRDPERWPLADPAQAFAYPNHLGGSGNSAAWASLIGSINDMTRSSPRARLEAIARHNRALGKVFLETLKPVSRRIEVITPLRGGRPPSGMVTIGIRPPVGEKVANRLREEGFGFTLLDSEVVHWRSEEPNRFLLKREAGFPTIEPAEPRTATSPKKARIDLRFCFHYWHSQQDVESLAKGILEAFDEG